MNLKKIKATLVTLGNKNIDLVMEQLEVMSHFDEYMKEKYDLSDEEVEKMMDVYLETRNHEIETIMEERINELDITEMEDTDKMVDILYESVIDLTPKLMTDYAKLHGYDKIEEYNKCAEIYVANVITKGMFKNNL